MGDRDAARLNWSPGECRCGENQSPCQPCRASRSIAASFTFSGGFCYPCENCLSGLFKSEPMHNIHAYFAGTARIAEHDTIQTVISRPVHHLKCVAIGLTGPNAERVIERRYEDLSVADLSGARPGRDSFDRPVGILARHRHFDAKLRQEVHDVFGAAVDLSMTLLPPVAFDLRHGHAAQAKPAERLTYFIELERLDDRDDDLHWRPPSLCRTAPRQRAWHNIVTRLRTGSIG